MSQNVDDQSCPNQGRKNIGPVHQVKFLQSLQDASGDSQRETESERIAHHQEKNTGISEKADWHVEEPVHVEAAQDSRRHQDKTETAVGEQACVHQARELVFVAGSLEFRNVANQ